MKRLIEHFVITDSTMIIILMIFTYFPTKNNFMDWFHIIRIKTHLLLVSPVIVYFPISVRLAFHSKR